MYYLFCRFIIRGGTLAKTCKNSTEMAGKEELPHPDFETMSRSSSLGVLEAANCPPDSCGPGDGSGHPYGCHKGYCWTRCYATEPWLREWCYTTKGYSQDFNYVKCNVGDDCCRCWKCAGACTV